MLYMHGMLVCLYIHTCAGQKTTLGVCLSPIFMWTLRTELMSLNLYGKCQTHTSYPDNWHLTVVHFTEEDLQIA